MQKLKSNLTCSYCHKIYKNPIELPCEHNICGEHLIEKDVEKQSKIKCATCKEEFVAKGNEFKNNNHIQKQLDDQLHLSVEEISLKQKIEDSFKLFYQMYEEFSLSKNKLDLDFHNHFQEIRRKIDEHRENLREKIDDIYMEMIEKTKEFETSYLKSLNQNFTSHFQSYDIKSINEELKEMEDKFRDPNLSVESFGQIQLRQNEAILPIIKEEINLMSQIRDNLKVSNQFKPNLSFDEIFFGQLVLNEYSIDPFKSHILTGQQPTKLIQLCEFNIDDTFKLLYRGSQDGFDSINFHSKCDGHKNTLTILKTIDASFVFGGFTSEAWDVSGDWKSDSDAFLFSLTNKDNNPCKMKIDSNQSQFAILCNSEYGPTFGDGPDIYVDSNANTTRQSYSRLGNTFKHLQYRMGTNEARSFLAGSIDFQLSEIEIYEIQ